MWIYIRANKCVPQNFLQLLRKKCTTFDQNTHLKFDWGRFVHLLRRRRFGHRRGWWTARKRILCAWKCLRNEISIISQFPDPCSYFFRIALFTCGMWKTFRRWKGLFTFIPELYTWKLICREFSEIRKMCPAHFPGEIEDSRCIVRSPIIVSGLYWSLTKLFISAPQTSQRRPRSHRSLAGKRVFIKFRSDNAKHRSLN